MEESNARLCLWREQVRRRREENSGYSGVAKTCGHDQCSLNLSTCCACTDHRSPETAIYHVYIDGQGMQQGERWSWYCDACKNTFREAELETVRQGQADTTSMSETDSLHSLRRARVLANYQRVFGTREDIEDTDYESPITTMFTRAWSRYRDQQAQDTQEESGDMYEGQTRDSSRASEDLGPSGGNELSFADSLPSFSREHSPAPVAEVDFSDVLSIIRPAPIQSDLLINVECKICFAQVADILFLPCAHLVLCSYCAPIVKLEGPREQRRDKCVVCRSKVARKLKVFR